MTGSSRSTRNAHSIRLTFFRINRALPIAAGMFLMLGACKQQVSESETVSVVKGSDLVSKIQKEFGVMPYIGQPFYDHDWDDYAACSPAALKTHFRQLAASFPSDLRINQYELFTVAIGEGLGWRYDEEPNEKEFMEDTVSGYEELGLDYFYDDVTNLRKLSLLPAAFREAPSKEAMLKGQGDFILEERDRSEAADNGSTVKVHSAVFRDLKASITAFAAMYAYRRHQFRAAAKTLPKPSLNEDAYWTYQFFQNPKFATARLRKAGRLSVLDGKPAQDSARPSGIPAKSLKRVATMQHLIRTNSLEDGAICKTNIYGGGGAEK